MKRHVLALGFIALAGVFLISGCAPGVKIRMESRDRDLERATGNRILERFDEFNVYAFEWRKNIPGAVVFETKSDNYKIVMGEGWRRVSSREDFEKLSNWGRKLKSKFDSRLYRVMGPDDEVWAYFVCAWNNLPYRMIDERTLRLLPIPEPPSPGP